MIEWIILAIIIIIVVAIILIYNRLIVLKNRVKNAWAQIDVQLKRRTDLIPNLMETVKGYMKYEKSVMIEVTKARTSLMNAGTVKEKAAAEGMLQKALKSLFAVAENYPELKASKNFMQLQEELSGTENKIAYARQFYNDSTMEFNNAIQVFPNNLFAGLFGFKEEEFFETSEEEKKPVKVSF